MPVVEEPPSTVQVAEEPLSTSEEVRVPVAREVPETTVSTVSDTGSLSVADSDWGQAKFSTVVRDWNDDASENIGSLSITSNGSWTYTLDNTHPLIQKMSGDEYRTESFLVESIDGTARQRVDVVVNGTDDIVSQYASSILNVSTEGKNNDIDSDNAGRWMARQALGAPNSNFGDLDTAWSPGMMNSDSVLSGSSSANPEEPDEFIEVGFSRSVKATRARIYENSGLGFVRSIWGVHVDSDGTKTWMPDLWTGIDNAGTNTNEIGVLDVALDNPEGKLINGLVVLVDTNHSSYWEQIDAVELIGIATEETYKPTPPIFDEIAEDNIINYEEKQAGVLLTGTYDKNATTHVEIEWNNKVHVAELNTEDGFWWVTVNADDIPADTEVSTIKAFGYDRSDSRSGDLYKSDPSSTEVRIDSTPPEMPSIDIVSDDNVVNYFDKYTSGVTLKGTADPETEIEVTWDYKQARQTTADQDGNWEIEFTSTAIPMDSDTSKISVVAIDKAGNRSQVSSSSVIVDTRAPAKVGINSVNWTDSVNAIQKANGVYINGVAEQNSTIDIAWEHSDDSVSSKTVTASHIGVMGAGPTSTQIDIYIGPLLLGSTVTGSTGEFTYVFDEQALATWAIHTSDSESRRLLNYKAPAISDSRQYSIVFVEGMWSAFYEEAEIPADTLSSNIEVKATDPQGNQSRARINRVLIDTTPPEIPTITTIDRYINAEDQRDSLIIKGEADIGSTIELEINGQTTTARASSGRWIAQFTPDQLTIVNELAATNNGEASLKIRAFDRLGNSSQELIESIYIDSVAPTVPVFDDSIPAYVNNQNRVKGFSLSGLAEANSVVRLVWDRSSIVTEAGADGRWSATFRSDQIPVDSISSLISATAIDRAGNESVPVDRLVKIDTVAPSVSLETFSSSALNNKVNADGATITGVGEAGKTVELWARTGDGKYTLKISEATANSDGSYELAFSKSTIRSSSPGPSSGISFGMTSPVTAGTTLADLAHQYGTSVEALLLLNDLSTDHVDITGLEIEIPADITTIGLVNNLAGKTPSTVAAEFNINVDWLMELNGIIDADSVFDEDTHLLIAGIQPLGATVLPELLEVNDGTYYVYTQQVDEAGNIGRSSEYQFVLDTVGPTIVLEGFGPGENTLSSAENNTVITGTADPNRPISLSVLDGVREIFLGNVVTEADGSFSYQFNPGTLSLIGYGSGFELILEQSDDASNIESVSHTFSIDPPVITSAGVEDEVLTTGKDDTLITGKSAAYSEVSLYAMDANGDAVTIGETVSNSDGLFSTILSIANLEAVGQGLKSIWAKVTNDYGRTSAEEEGLP